MIAACGTIVAPASKTSALPSAICAEPVYFAGQHLPCLLDAHRYAANINARLTAAGRAVFTSKDFLHSR
jgi:hypothetical protein